MNLVKVNVIRLQAAQRVPAGADHAFARQALAARAVRHPPADLCGNDEFLAVATRLHPPADDLLRPSRAGHAVRTPRRVDVRRVDEIATRRDKRVHDRERRLLVRGPAKLHGAKAKLGDIQFTAAKFPKVHGARVVIVARESREFTRIPEPEFCPRNTRKPNPS